MKFLPRAGCPASAPDRPRKARRISVRADRAGIVTGRKSVDYPVDAWAIHALGDFTKRHVDHAARRGQRRVGSSRLVTAALAVGRVNVRHNSRNVAGTPSQLTESPWRAAN